MLDKWTKETGAPSSSGNVVEPTHESAPPANGVAVAPLQLEQALSQLEDDRELLLEVVEIFVATIPELLTNLQAACDAADAETISSIAHSIKGAASNICAEPIRASAETLEKDGRDGAVENAAAAVTQLHHQFEQFKVFAKTLV